MEEVIGVIWIMIKVVVRNETGFFVEEGEVKIGMDIGIGKIFCC